ncbi:MAG TPA: bifunctional acetate--CoA ligase family protein/GNAT family N-acetyltransferase [Verrucomicrobiae bacterium]|jgi:acetyltransferase|nr:bifunctional acetate--CoA ligase family protein/GNAT family N-acetyltransferase [Verrucomicrobiae bacterium]
MSATATPCSDRAFSPVADILRPASGPPLDCIFDPHAIALIGASDVKGSVGRTLLENLLRDGFKGRVYPIHPKRDTILRHKTYASLAALPEKVDLAVISTAAATMPEILRDCGRAGVRGAIIISEGPREGGSAGAAWEAEILEEARKAGVRLAGPHCLGVMTPRKKLNASCAACLARPGSVGFITQSGALGTAALDWSLRENVGFSAFISLGAMLDIGWGDLIYHLGDDPHTKSIVIYMESIGDARAFLSAAREVALSKPIIVIKPGRTTAGGRALSDEVWRAALQRVGVLQVNTISELFDMAEVLAKQPRPKGPRLAIVTNAGGPAVVAADMLLASGGQLAELCPHSLAAYEAILPPSWNRRNPIEIGGDASPELYAKAVEIAAQDPNTDGLLVVLTPHAATQPTATAEQLKPFAHLHHKPIIASWMGANQVEAGEEILNAASIPTFKYPDRAARAFCQMWRYSENLRALYETPAAVPDHAAAARAKAAAIMQRARQKGRGALTEVESKEILDCYGIPTVETRIAATEAEAVKEANALGFPVALKIFSETVARKTEVGGVRLHLRTEAAVRQAWKAIAAAVAEKAGAPPFQGVTVQPMARLDGCEISLGSVCDAEFGPALYFGCGGPWGEALEDRAMTLPPLNATLARRLMERAKIFAALQGGPGRDSVDVPELEQLLVRFSQLVEEQPWIREIRIDPLLASPERIVALDARIVLHDPATPETQLPRPAIRPYPAQYVSAATLKNHQRVTIRPIKPEDEPLLVKFHQTLSEESVYHRYFSVMKLSQRTAHERLTRICAGDYDREIALVAEYHAGACGRQILGVGRLNKLHGLNEAEFALLISDAWQGQGLGAELMRRLVEVGRGEMLARIIGHILPDNHAMQHVCRKVGFKIEHDPENHDFLAAYGF